MILLFSVFLAWEVAWICTNKMNVQKTMTKNVKVEKLTEMREKTPWTCEGWARGKVWWTKEEEVCWMKTGRFFPY
jgi:hypothetical protein